MNEIPNNNNINNNNNNMNKIYTECINTFPYYSLDTVFWDPVIYKMILHEAIQTDSHSLLESWNIIPEIFKKKILFSINENLTWVYFLSWTKYIKYELSNFLDEEYIDIFSNIIQVLLRNLILKENIDYFLSNTFPLDFFMNFAKEICNYRKVLEYCGVQDTNLKEYFKLLEKATFTVVSNKLVLNLGISKHHRFNDNFFGILPDFKGVEISSLCNWKVIEKLVCHCYMTNQKVRLVKNIREPPHGYNIDVRICTTNLLLLSE